MLERKGLLVPLYFAEITVPTLSDNKNRIILLIICVSTMHWMLSTLYVCSILPFLPGAGGRGFSSSYFIYLSNRDIDKF